MAGQTQEMTDSSKPKGLAARILGEQPTGLQKTFFWLMILSLTLWPLLFFVSLFFFDAPIRTTVDEISRWGMVLTIWLYPLYLLPLMRSWFQLSKCLRATWLFYLCPLIPIIIFFSFVELASSEYAAKKPKGYDPATFERLNESFAKDINHVYFYNEILEVANPKTFRALDEDYSADSRHVWYRKDIIEGANPQTFVAPEKNNSLDISIDLAHDDHDYYNQNNPLHVADMGSFKRIDGSWAVDRQNVYYIGLEAEIGKDIVPIGDFRTFRVLNDFYAADAKYVYYKNKVVRQQQESRGRFSGITGSVLLIIFRSLISLCFITCLIRISFNLKKDQKNRPHGPLTMAIISILEMTPRNFSQNGPSLIII